MASQPDRSSPFDNSRLNYYEKAPLEEDTSHQVSDVEDISIGLAEDLSFLISGANHGGGQLGTADINILYPGDGNCPDDQDIEFAVSDSFGKLLAMPPSNREQVIILVKPVINTH